MKARVTLSAALLAAVLGSSAQEPIFQSIRIDATQSAFARVLREDGPLNAGNILGLPEWRSSLEAEIEWNIDIAHRVRVSALPLVSWDQAGGSVEGLAFESSASLAGDPRISLPQAEAWLSLPEIGMEAVFGKLKPEAGTNYIEPMSAVRPRGREYDAEGRWMAGIFLSMGDAALEAYCETAQDPEAFACLSALFGDHEAGILWRRALGDCAGVFWRSQLGEGMIAYAEAALREKGDFLDIPGLPGRGIGWNADALAGLGLTPRDLGLSLYIEYRYRSAGYGASDYAALNGLPPPLQGAALSGLSFLQTARHAIGIHAMSETASGGILSWSATGFFFPPDGLDLSARVDAKIAESCGIGAEFSAALPLSGAGNAASETAFRPEALNIAIELRWSIDAREGE